MNALGVQLVQSMAVLAVAKLEPALVVVNVAVCDKELLPHSVLDVAVVMCAKELVPAACEVGLLQLPAYARAASR